MPPPVRILKEIAKKQNIMLSEAFDSQSVYMLANFDGNIVSKLMWNRAYKLREANLLCQSNNFYNRAKDIYVREKFILLA